MSDTPVSSLGGLMKSEGSTESSEDWTRGGGEDNELQFEGTDLRETEGHSNTCECT